MQIYGFTHGNNAQKRGEGKEQGRCSHPQFQCGLRALSFQMKRKKELTEEEVVALAAHKKMIEADMANMEKERKQGETKQKFSCFVLSKERKRGCETKKEKERKQGCETKKERETLGDDWWNHSSPKTAVSCCVQPLENGRTTIQNAMDKGSDNFEITSNTANTDIKYSAAYKAAEHHLCDYPSTACKTVSNYPPDVEIIMQQIKKHVNTHGLCKVVGGKNTEIHSQSGKRPKVDKFHSQYHAPRNMVVRYTNVAKLFGGEDIIIRAASMFVSNDIPELTLTSTADTQIFLLRHMDTDCLLTLFVSLSNDESWVIYDKDNVVVAAKLTNPAGMNITVTNGIHSGKKTHNPHQLKHCSKCLSERVLIRFKIDECPEDGMNMKKSNAQWIEFVKKVIPTIWPEIQLD